MEFPVTAADAARKHTTSVRAAVVLALCVLVVAGPLARPHAEAGVARQIGKLERYPADARRVFATEIRASLPESFDPDPHAATHHAIEAASGTIVSIPEFRQIWQMWWFQRQDGTFKTGVIVRNMDSLKMIHHMLLPYPLTRVNGGGDWYHDLDIKGRRLFLAAGPPNYRPTSLIVADATTFKVKRLAMALPADNLGRVWGPMGLSYDPEIGRLWSAWGIFGATGVSPGTNFLVRLNPDVAEGEDSFDGLRLMRGCRGPLPTLIHLGEIAEGNYASAIVRKNGRLYVPCHREGASGAIAIFNAATALDQSSDESLIVGPTDMFSVLADPVTGRMAILTRPGEIWIFDVMSEVFVGTVATGTEAVGKTSYGIDQSDGRLYFMTPRYGFGSTEMRFTPVAQGRVWPELGSRSRHGWSQERIWSDAKTGRVFVLDGTSTAKARAYRILAVSGALPPPKRHDPDLNTADVEERPSITESYYEGSATGYGIRVLAAGGLSTIVPAPGLGAFTPTSRVLAGYLNPKCVFTDRELVSARVARSELSTGASAAESIGVLLDERSRQDLRSPARCDIQSGRESPSPFEGVFGTFPQLAGPVNDNLGQEWTQEAASCSDPGSDPKEAAGEPPLGKATTTCSTEASRVEATAVGHTAGPYVDGTAWVRTAVYKDSTRGIVSRAEAVSEDVDLFGVARIARIKQVAESWARGRPGTAHAKREITVEGVQINGQTSCTDDCEIDGVIRTLNQALVGRAYFIRGVGTDEELFRGSPRGAQAGVKKSELQVSSDRALIGDVTNEVSALQMITYNDTSEWGRSRLVVQFAGVATASTYNISLIPTGVGPFNPPPLPPAPIPTLGPLAPPPPAAPEKPAVKELSPVIKRIVNEARLLVRNVRSGLAVAVGLAPLLWPVFLAGRRKTFRELSSETESN